MSGISAEDIAEAKDHVEIQLDDGRVIRSSWVIDTRPQKRELHKPWLWQNFVGYVVECSAADTPYNSIPSLMEFKTPATASRSSCTPSLSKMASFYSNATTSSPPSTERKQHWRGTCFAGSMIVSAGVGS